MIFNHAVNVGGFIYCTTYYGPHTTSTYYNENDGHYDQCLYIVEGAAKGEVRNSNDISENPLLTDTGYIPGTLLDVSHTKSKYVTTTTNDIGLSIMMFNPIPTTRDLNIEIVKGTTIKTITAGDSRITLVCISGPITVNDKIVESLQHVKILPGKTVTIILPEHAIFATVQDK